jgi:hypothetical protein
MQDERLKVEMLPERVETANEKWAVALHMLTHK